MNCVVNSSNVIWGYQNRTQYFRFSKGLVTEDSLEDRKVYSGKLHHSLVELTVVQPKKYPSLRGENLLMVIEEKDAASGL